MTDMSENAQVAHTMLVMFVAIGVWEFTRWICTYREPKPRRRIRAVTAPRRIDGESVESDLEKDYRGNLD